MYICSVPSISQGSTQSQGQSVAMGLSVLTRPAEAHVGPSRAHVYDSPPRKGYPRLSHPNHIIVEQLEGESPVSTMPHQTVHGDFA